MNESGQFSPHALGVKGMEQIAVERSIWIAAPRERVWRAVTDSEQLSQWYAPGSTWEIPVLKVGGIGKFYNTPDDIVVHIIEVVDPPCQFTLRWKESHPPHPAVTMFTTFLLEEEKGGTRVTIHEEGFEQLPDDVRRKRVDQTAEGYRMSMENLKAYVEGRSLPF